MTTQGTRDPEKIKFLLSLLERIAQDSNSDYTRVNASNIACAIRWATGEDGTSFDDLVEELTSIVESRRN